MGFTTKNRMLNNILFYFLGNKCSNVVLSQSGNSDEDCGKDSLSLFGPLCVSLLKSVFAVLHLLLSQYLCFVAVRATSSNTAKRTTRFSNTSSGTLGKIDFSYLLLLVVRAQWLERRTRD